MFLLTRRVLSAALLCLSSTSVLAFAPPAAHRGNSGSSNSKKLFVATETSVDISDLGRGMGGRIEEAFAASKEKGEAAFVTFVTAGYPTADGRFTKNTFECCALTLQ